MIKHRFLCCLLFAIAANSHAALITTDPAMPTAVAGSMSQFDLIYDGQGDLTPLLAFAAETSSTNLSGLTFTPGPLFGSIVGADPPFNVSGEALSAFGETGTFTLGTIMFTAGDPGPAVITFDDSSPGGFQFASEFGPDVSFPAVTVTVVPEPSTIALWTAASIALGLQRRMRSA